MLVRVFINVDNLMYEIASFETDDVKDESQIVSLIRNMKLFLGDSICIRVQQTTDNVEVDGFLCTT